MHIRKRRDKWTLQFADPSETRRELTLFADKAASSAVAGKIARMVELRRAQEPLPADLMRAADSLDKRILRALASWGVIETDRSGQTLKDLADRYVMALDARERSQQHIRETGGMIGAFLEETRAVWPRDMTADRAEKHLRGIRERGISARRHNAVLQALRGFARWMVADAEALTENPLRRIKPLNVKTDRRRVRRAMTEGEVASLLHATENASKRYGMTGAARRVAYALALGTGLRYNEILLLEWRDVDLDRKAIHVRASTTKNGADAALPLRADLAEGLRQHLARALPGRRAFAKMQKDRGAEMLRADLDAAGVAYETDQGFVDFHSLRHTFVSGLAKAGVHPSVAQRLARHSTIQLTMGTYTHVRLDTMQEAVDALPAVRVVADAASRTGTDDAGQEPFPAFQASCADDAGQEPFPAFQASCADGTAQEPFPAFQASPASADGRGTERKEARAKKSFRSGVRSESENVRLHATSCDFETMRKEDKKTAETSPKAPVSAGFANGGERWIRTIEGVANGFTVRPNSGSTPERKPITKDDLDTGKEEHRNNAFRPGVRFPPLRIPKDVERIASVWSTLPNHIKAAILTLASTPASLRDKRGKLGKGTSTPSS